MTQLRVLSSPHINLKVSVRTWILNMMVSFKIEKKKIVNCWCFNAICEIHKFLVNSFLSHEHKRHALLRFLKPVLLTDVLGPPKTQSQIKQNPLWVIKFRWALANCLSAKKSFRLTSVMDYKSMGNLIRKNMQRRLVPNSVRTRATLRKMLVGLNWEFLTFCKKMKSGTSYNRTSW